MNQESPLRQGYAGQAGIRISGKVVHGDNYGRKLGFPTANLDRRDYSRRKLKIKFGVYAGQASINPQTNLKFYKAGIVIGPLDKLGLPKIEAHLLGFKGNLYGKQLHLYLNKYLRPFRKFKNVEELKKQIKEDISLIKN